MMINPLLILADVLRNKVASDIDLKHTTATWSNVRLAAAVQSNNKWEYSMAFTPSQISVKVTVASGMLKVTTVIPGDLTETLKGESDNQLSLSETLCGYSLNTATLFVLCLWSS